MYKILYNDQSLYDPIEETETLSVPKLSGETNVASYLDFSIAPTHPLYDVLRELDGIVKVYSDDVWLFDGQIEKITMRFNGVKDIEVQSSLSYLSDTIVRPYSTVSGERPLLAPSSIDGYFQWLIDQHNENVLDSRKQFIVGVNQGAALTDSNHIYRSSDSMATTASEITSKILDVYGGYLVIRYEDNIRYLDLYADIHESNAQIIDFGVNLIDLTKTLDTGAQYTAVRPVGGIPENEKVAITIDSLPDGVTTYNSDVVKTKDVVYSSTAIRRYGYREYSYTNQDITVPEDLLKSAVTQLLKLEAPIVTLDVKAVDLALYMEGYKHLQIGQAVRVRSNPHNIDEYLMVKSIDLDLADPGNTEYVLGVSYDTLTGQQSSYLKSLNGSINTALDNAASIKDDVKELANKVPLSEAYEYASSASKTVAPDDGWSSDMPHYIAGKYLWQRVTKHYENNVTTISEPVMITGNSSAVLKIKSTNGLQFKNGIIKTSFYASVYYGNEVVDTLTDLRLLYGETATLVWSIKNTEDSDPVVIQASDPRLANDGFRMDITADDVNTKATFYCELYS